MLQLAHDSDAKDLGSGVKLNRLCDNRKKNDTRPGRIDARVRTKRSRVLDTAQCYLLIDDRLPFSLVAN